jgi:hypothetical protein
MVIVAIAIEPLRTDSPEHVYWTHTGVSTVFVPPTAVQSPQSYQLHPDRPDGLD